jgi:hypothetical protein
VDGDKGRKIVLVCICVYMYVCTYVFMYGLSGWWKRKKDRTCLYVCVYIHVCMHLCICSSVLHVCVEWMVEKEEEPHLSVCTSLYMHVACLFKCMHTYACMCENTHAVGKMTCMWLCTYVCICV